MRDASNEGQDMTDATEIGASRAISDHFALVPIGQIQISRDQRQRQGIDTKGLVESIAKIGLLQPPVVTRALALVAGERRLEACRQLGWDIIPVRFVDQLTPVQLQILELEENVKRSDLCWQDLVRAAGRIHALFLTQDPDWTQGETAEALSLTQGLVSRYLIVYARLDDDKIAEADTVTEAYNTINRQLARASGDAIQELLDMGGESSGEAVSQQDLPDDTAPALAMPGGIAPALAPPAGRILPVEQTILCETFLHWAPKYARKKFNFIHCDFPYGINLFAGPQAGGKRHGDYSDGKDIYFALLETLCSNLDRLMQVSGHLVFWYSEKHGDATKTMFRQLAPSLEFYRHPLVWLKSDNTGIAADARREPRHVYETAMFASRGQRQIVKIVADAYAAPTDKRFHVSTKPEPVLRHFFSLLVDENTSLLDPTCGGASAIRVAEEMGAVRCLGMDIDEQAVGIARVALRNARMLQMQSKGR
jgi:ParB family chromosome partitioning protein